MYHVVGRVIMPWWVEPQGHTVVIVFVYLCFVLKRDFLSDCNELSNEGYNATTTQHSNTG